MKIIEEKKSVILAHVKTFSIKHSISIALFKTLGQKPKSKAPIESDVNQPKSLLQLAKEKLQLPKQELKKDTTKKLKNYYYLNDESFQEEFIVNKNNQRYYYTTSKRTTKPKNFIEASKTHSSQGPHENDLNNIYRPVLNFLYFFKRVHEVI